MSSTNGNQLLSVLSRKPRSKPDQDANPRSAQSAPDPSSPTSSVADSVSSLLDIPVDGYSFESPDDAGPVDPEAAGQEPKRRRRRTNPDAPPPRTRRSAGADKVIINGLVEFATEGGAILAMFAPTTAAVIIADAEVNATALVAYAQDKPKMLANLAKVGKIGPVGKLIKGGTRLGTAIGIDVGAVDPATPLPTILGVSQIHYDIMGEMDRARAAFQAPEPPPWFVPMPATATGN